MQNRMEFIYVLGSGERRVSFLDEKWIMSFIDSNLLIPFTYLRFSSYVRHKPTYLSINFFKLKIRILIQVINMSKIWNSYFTKSAGIAFCNVDKNVCKYSKEFPAQAPTSTLISHLKNNHPEQYKKYMEESRKTESPKPTTIKRVLELRDQECSSTTITIDDVPKKQQKIEHSLPFKSIWILNGLFIEFYFKGQWDKDGEKTVAVNQAIMKMIATDIQPFSVVDDAGFRELVQKLQPKYSIPSRKYFTDKMMPEMYENMKVFIILEILEFF